MATTHYGMLAADAKATNNNTTTQHNNAGLNYFGPASPTGFDFTPLFEDTILGILPSALLLLALPYRILTLQRAKPKVARGGLLSDNKHLFLNAFAAMQLILLVMFSLNDSLRTKATLASAALVFACSVGICLLSHLEHVRSVRPSLLINSYLLLTLPFDMARTRTLFLSDASKPLAGVFSGMIGVKILVLIAEAMEKRGILLEPYRGLSPEETSGIYSRSFFFWLNKLMTSGFSRLLSNSDLYPIDSQMSAATLKSEMQRSWAAGSSPANKGQPRVLFWAMLWANRWALGYCVLPRLVQLAFRYTQPFLLARTVAFASDQSQPERIGWGLTGAFFLVFLGLAVSNGFYYHMCYRFVASVRGALVSIIYTKTVDLSITALDESAAVTLMSSDTQVICMAMETLNDLWAVPLEVCIAMYLLFRQLGVAFAAPLVLAIVSVAGILCIASYTGAALKIWMQGIQSRVNVTANMLSSMKSVKMLGFSSLLHDTVHALRVKELKLASKFRKLLVFRIFLGNTLTTLAPFLTFAAFALHTLSSGKVINAQTAYTTLTLISLLASPLNDMIRAIPSLNSAMASLMRIQSFLESDARKDHRVPLRHGSSSGSSDDGVSQEGIELDGRTVAQSSGPSRVIHAQNVSFSWTSDDDSVIRDVSFDIMRGEICMIIGPVGAGKSTLLKGILGETPSTKGFLYTDCPEVAFVDQTPWIRNRSLRDNILGVSPYDDSWYKQVVQACALDQDIAGLPQGHCT
jgi:ATP-binding cassette subfamily C (CFTR/MRP) protein 1